MTGIERYVQDVQFLNHEAVDLNKKLKDEVSEYFEDNNVEELADIVEVIYGILNAKNIELEEFTSHYTDFFEDYDYVVGDIAYGKLRLKGFYDSSNKKAKKINDIKYLDKYLEENCAVECKYFVVKKIKDER